MDFDAPAGNGNNVIEPLLSGKHTYSTRGHFEISSRVAASRQKHYGRHTALLWHTATTGIVPTGSFFLYNATINRGVRSKRSSTVLIHIHPGQLHCSAAAVLVYYYCTCMYPLTKTGTYYDKKNSFSTEVRETAMQQAQQYAAKYSIVVLNVLVVKTARHVGCSCAKKTHHNGSCSPGLVLGYTRIPFDVHTAVSSGYVHGLTANSGLYSVLWRVGTARKCFQALDIASVRKFVIRIVRWTS